MCKSKVIAYHFVGAALRDGRPVPKVGKWLVHDGTVVPCRSGLHASFDVRDALKYAPGNTLCVVELGGTIIEHDGDKVVASKRKILAKIDADYLLCEFSRKCAHRVLHLWDAPKVVHDYLATGNESLRDAAWAAARAKAWDAAWDAARAAERAAERAKAWAAAWDAARAAERAAARDESLLDAARAAARAAERAKAWAAEEKYQADLLRSMVRQAFKEIGYEDAP